jgi:predicted DNA-binding helix-hairpin-helix protein
MIIGGSPESDQQIMQKADELYKNFHLKRVYYSGYIPVSNDSRLPALSTPPPIIRENRLYQTDWLLRFYGFSLNELLNEAHPNLELEMDPKLAWALRNMHVFPVDVNKADYELILRIPGLGVKSAKKIVASRKFGKLTIEHLRKFGVMLSRAKYFLVCESNGYEIRDLTEEKIKNKILSFSQGKFAPTQQLSLF